jgi:hypothetical protein
MVIRFNKIDIREIKIQIMIIKNLSNFSNNWLSKISNNEIE